MEKSTLPTLSEIDLTIIEAKRSKNIRYASADDILIALGEIMHDLGEQPDKITSFIESDAATRVIKNLKLMFPKIHIKELTLAFDLAAAENEKFNVKLSLFNRSFNFEFIAKVLKAYLRFIEPTRRRIAKEDFEIELSDEDQNTYDQKKLQIVKVGIENAYNHYVKTGKMPPACAWMYDHLKESGKIKFTEHEENEIKFGKAKDRLEKKLKDSYSELGRTDKKNLLDRLERLANDPELNTMFKQVALQIHWDRHINK